MQEMILPPPQEWPLTGNSLQFATHSVRVTDKDVCQIRYSYTGSSTMTPHFPPPTPCPPCRLDFLNFTMAGPSLSHFPIGQLASKALEMSHILLRNRLKRLNKDWGGHSFFRK